MEAYHDHPIPELPTEIIFSHILPRLPAEDLMTRCRCVCKSWTSLIRSPSFVAAFLNFRCKDTTHFLFEYNNRYFSSKIEQQGNAPTPVAQLPYLTQCRAFQGRFHDVKTLHGLVCASTWFGPVFILNPTTRESIELPHTDVLIETQGKAFANYNFGFNPLTNEYKVLQFISVDPSGLTKWDFELNIFTIGTDSSWRPLQVHQHSHLLSEIAHGIRNDGVYINGAVHWIHKEQKVIVAFDVREETFTLVPLPQDYAQVFEDIDDYESDDDCYCRGSARVVEVEGCVGVFVVAKSDRIVSWILKDYQNHVWIKQTVSLMSRDDLGRRCSVRALGTIHTGELAFVRYFLGLTPGFNDGPPQLHLYDMKTKRFRILDFVFLNSVMRYDREDSGSIRLISSYEESIVPLK
ncbi:hypothetical protein CerSpe_250560 [Prunus speciosa]